MLMFTVRVVIRLHGASRDRGAFLLLRSSAGFPPSGAATPRRGTMGSVLSSEPQAPEERSALQKEINKVMFVLERNRLMRRIGVS